MMPSAAALRLTHPVTVPSPANGRGAASGAEAASFAALLGGDSQAGDPTAAATGDPAASERHDDAAPGSMMPPTDPAIPTAADAGWLVMFAGSAPAANPPVLDAEERSPSPLSGNNAAMASTIVDLPTAPTPPPSGVMSLTPPAIVPVETANSGRPDAVSPGTVRSVTTAGLLADAVSGRPPALPPESGDIALRAGALVDPAVAAPTLAVPSTSGAPITPGAIAGPAWPAAQPAAPTVGVGSSGVVAPPPAAAIDLALPALRISSAPMAQAGSSPLPVPPTMPDGDARPRAMAATIALATALPTATPAATTAPLAAPVAAPAGEVFAAAIHAAGRAQPDDARDSDPIAQQVASLVATAAAPGAVTATAGRGDAGLDMRRDSWPSAMVDHIERLRDAVDATDTRIRLVPDALGSIDVALRRHDDGVRVSLAAHQPATQALLAEARPQLTELAQARGIRLTDASASAGGQGFTDAQRQSPARPATPNAPASATITDHSDPADSRVA